MTWCLHKPEFVHAAPKLVVASCAKCGMKWSGDPSKPSAPRWVKGGLEAALKALSTKAKP